MNPDDTPCDTKLLQLEPDTPSRLFIAPVDALLAYASVLAKDELHRAYAYAGPTRRDQFIAGRSLLRLALSFGNDTPPEAWRFHLHAGKPALPEDLGLNLSLSHSGKWVGCALSMGSVCGFDLQQHAAKSLREIVAAFFPVAEREWLDKQSDYVQAFYQLWTLKESSAKALGMPLLAAIGRILFAPPEAGPAITGMRACTAGLEDNMTMAWIADQAKAEWEAWRWRGSAFAAFNPDALAWVPMYDFPPYNDEVAATDA